MKSSSIALPVGAGFLLLGGAGATSVVAQAPSVCESWERDLEVSFPERIARGSSRQATVGWAEGSSAGATASPLSVVMGDGPVVVLPAPAPDGVATVPLAAPASGRSVTVRVEWLQDAGEWNACAGSVSAVIKITPRVAALQKYVTRVRPSFRVWARGLNSAQSYVDDAGRLLRGASDSNVPDALARASRAGIALGRAVPGLKSSGRSFQQRVLRVRPPTELRAAHRRMSLAGVRLARAIEVSANTLGRTRSIGDLLIAARAIDGFDPQTRVRAWAKEVIADYQAGGRTAPAWVRRLDRD